MKFYNRIFNISNYHIDNDFLSKLNLISKNNNINKILEIGCSDRPFLTKNEKWSYDGLDIDSKVNANKYFNKFYCQDIQDKIIGNYDLIFSKYLLEHVENVPLAYNNMFEALKKGGSMVHIYPIGFHPFSIIAKLFPNSIVKKLISILRPDSVKTTGYKAYYNLGLSYSLVNFFKKNNYKYEIKYYYSAEDYFSFLFPIGIIIYFFDRICSLLNIHIFSSGVMVCIKK